jgi:hypothetical protein
LFLKAFYFFHSPVKKRKKNLVGARRGTGASGSRGAGAGGSRGRAGIGGSGGARRGAGAGSSRGTGAGDIKGAGAGGGKGPGASFSVVAGAGSSVGADDQGHGRGSGLGGTTNSVGRGHYSVRDSCGPAMKVLTPGSFCLQVVFLFFFMSFLLIIVKFFFMLTANDVGTIYKFIPVEWFHSLACLYLFFHPPSFFPNLYTYNFYFLCVGSVL